MCKQLFCEQLDNFMPLYKIIISSLCSLLPVKPNVYAILKTFAVPNKGNWIHKIDAMIFHT